MKFVVMAHDATDSEAPQRRLDAREAHFKVIADYKARGNILFGAAMLDDAEKMVGSVIIADFENRADLDQWLAIEPYVQQKVWGTVEVRQLGIGPSFKDVF